MKKLIPTLEHDFMYTNVPLQMMPKTKESKDILRRLTDIRTAIHCENMLQAERWLNELIWDIEDGSKPATNDSIRHQYAEWEKEQKRLNGDKSVTPLSAWIKAINLTL